MNMRTHLFPLASLLALPSLGAAQEPLWSSTGDDPFDTFGSPVGNAGDVDGDGIADALVGAVGMGTAGTVRVLSGATGALLLQLDGSQSGDRFSAAVAGLGDVDGDGRSDLAVGSPKRPFGAAAEAGRVQVFSGATGALLYTVDGQNEGARLGTACAGILDMDGDGIGELAVGAPGGSAAQPAGEVWILSGATGTLLATWTDGVPGSDFGTAVADAGDTDGDGARDVVVGAPTWTDGSQAGRVYVLSGASGAVLFERQGDHPSWRLGGAVDGAGDIDLDGRADVLVGSYPLGPALVLAGGSGAELYRFQGETWGDSAAVAGVGDVDGDGIPDLALGSPYEGAGRVVLRSGRDGSLLYERVAHAESSGYGRSLAALGDVDGDGRGELLVGQPYYGSNATGRAQVLGTRSVGSSYCGPAVANSTGVAAEIRAFGSDLAARNLLHLSVTNLPLGRKAYFLTSMTQGFVANPGGSQGNLCLGGTIGRFVDQLQTSDEHGSIGLRVDLEHMPPPVQQAVLPGETWSFQAWYRDANPTKTSNFSDALAVTFS